MKSSFVEILPFTLPVCLYNSQQTWSITKSHVFLLFNYPNYIMIIQLEHFIHYPAAGTFAFLRTDSLLLFCHDWGLFKCWHILRHLIYLAPLVDRKSSLVSNYYYIFFAILLKEHFTFLRFFRALLPSISLQTSHQHCNLYFDTFEQEVTIWRLQPKSLFPRNSVYYKNYSFKRFINFSTKKFSGIVTQSNDINCTLCFPKIVFICVGQVSVNKIFFKTVLLSILNCL